jgi:hypothetical protein
MIIKKIKKIAFSALSVALLGCLFIPTAAHATYYKASGLISRYDGDGKKGYDNITLGQYSCATDEYKDNPDAGKAIYVKDNTSGIALTFFKHDVGHFPAGVVLDLTYSGWAKFGHPAYLGRFSGEYFHS